jgi:membrane protein
MSAIRRAAAKPGRIIWKTLEQFMEDRCPQMAAAISFYAIFSLPPLLVLVIMLVEPLLDPDTVVRIMEREAAQMVGPEGAAQVQVLVENVSRPGQGSPIAATLGIGAFLFGATAAFGQLQNALNAAWQVGPDPRRGDVVNFLIQRALSFAMILGVGALLLLSLVLSTVLGAFGDTLELLSPAIPSAWILRLVDVGISFTLATLLFAAMYRFLPDAQVRRGSALFGGAVTAVLFTIGKAAIGYWLGTTGAGSAFGAAGSLAMVLIWIYYSSMTLLFGAELTQVLMSARGDPIRPKPGAVRVVREREQVLDGEGEAPPGREEER